MMNIEILRKLVSLNTIADEKNVDFINEVKKILEDKQFEVEVVKNDKGKQCLIAKKGQQAKLCFMGHSDTVPICNGWETNPFDVVIKENNIYGLGVCDMKGGISAFLTAISETEKVDGIMVIITFDEEVGFDGIKIIKDRNDIPNNVIIAEPTDLIPIAFCKGCVEYKITFIGKSVHSSLMPNGINAILQACDFINNLNKFFIELKKEKNDKFDIPYTTMNVGTIFGGSAINIVPDECSITFDFRTISKEHHKIIENKIKDMVKEYNCKVELITNVFPSTNNNLFELSEIEKITEKISTGVNYVTEGNFLNKSNIVILGPGPITAHEPNEHISIESYEKAIDIYKKIINKYVED